MPLFNDHTLTGLTLLKAPHPFNKLSGQTRRVLDCPLVNSWFKERCPPGNPVKVRVSYQKLLKKHVLNDLHKQKPKTKTKRSLFKAFANTKFFQKTEMDWVEAGL